MLSSRAAVLGLVVSGAGTQVDAGPPPAHLKEHPITIDATRLVPASWWQVPGITPSIYHSDPDSLDAPKTSEKRELQLKPGKYKFISFTFDFPFVVNLDGKLSQARRRWSRDDAAVEGVAAAVAGAFELFVRGAVLHDAPEVRAAG